MISEGQNQNRGQLNSNSFLGKINKTPLIFAAGVLLIFASNFLFNKINLRVEPISSWSPETILVIRAKKPDNFFSGVNEVLETLDPEFNTAISKILLKTGSSPLEMARVLLPEPIELIILEKNGEEAGDKLKYDFILVTKSAGSGIENLPNADAAAREFASWFIPTNRYTTLKDGSRVKTQIADPKQIKLQQEVFSNEDVIYISEPGLPFEYARSHGGAWLFFGTSKKAVEDAISKHNQTMPFEKLSRNCASPNKSVDVFFNPDTFRLNNRSSVLLVGSPIRSVLRLINRDKTVVKAAGIAVSWENCSF